MEKYLCALVLVALLSGQISAQTPDTLWTKTYGGTEFEYGFHIEPVSEGGSIVLAQTSSFGDNDMWILRIDDYGDTLWTHVYPEGHAGKIRQTADGGFILIGNLSTGISSSDIWVMKINSDGDSLWSASYDFEIMDVGVDARQCETGEFLLACSYDSEPGEVLRNAVLIKTDSLGNILWTNNYGQGLYMNQAAGVVILDNGNYVFAVQEGLIDSAQVKLFELDSDGNILSEQVSLSGFFAGSASIEHIDGDDVFSLGRVWGMYYSWSGTMCVKNCFSGGEPFSTIIVNDSIVNIPTDSRPTQDGCYIITGVYDCEVYENCDIWLLKLDEYGDTLWTTTCGYEGMCEFTTSVIGTTDGGYLVLSNTDATGQNSSDLWLLYFYEDSLSVKKSDYPNPLNYRLYPPYPNPFNQSTVVGYRLTVKSDVNLAIYDITGREVARLVDGFQSAGSHSITFDGSDLASGIYFVKLTAGDFIKTQKIVLLK